MPVNALAHSAICVSDIEAAVAWYRDVLGLKVLSPPYRMEGPSIEADMGELVPAPVVVEAAILGFEESDHVVELVSYPEAPAPAEGAGAPPLTRPGISHLGLLCDDVAGTRRQLEAKGVRFLTSASAAVAGLHTTWLLDPWGVRWILLDKRHPERPYWRQFPLAP